MALLLGGCLLLAVILGTVAVKSRQRRQAREWKARRQHRLHRDWWVWTWFNKSSKFKRLTYDRSPSDQD